MSLGSLTVLAYIKKAGLDGSKPSVLAICQLA